MKRRNAILFVVVGVILGALCFEFVCVCPRPSYSRISVGMTAAEVHRILGEPQDAMRDLKGVEIWIRSGVLLETCLAVNYLDQAHPDRATKVSLWMRKKIVSSGRMIVAIPLP
jgi:hypothetical protein